ncbi:MAG: divalent-cation tolerance protein CutA [Candidatus Ancaeobacter aquaticus]|nr:divalent-cation tolerance protein CutA [Candidatus Ancaeobacter aquaticus]
MDYVVVYVTVSSKKEGKIIAKALLEAKLAACVNIIDGVESFFWWEKKIDTAKESLLIIKTKKSIVPQLEKMVKKYHSYDVPEIIALPIVSGERKYLDWLEGSLK